MFKEKPMQKLVKLEQREPRLEAGAQAVDSVFSRITPDDIDQYGKKLQEKI